MHLVFGRDLTIRDLLIVTNDVRCLETVYSKWFKDYRIELNLEFVFANNFKDFGTLHGRQNFVHLCIFQVREKRILS